MVGDWMGSDGPGWDDSVSSLSSEPLCVCAWEIKGGNASATTVQNLPQFLRLIRQTPEKSRFLSFFQRGSIRGGCERGQGSRRKNEERQVLGARRARPRCERRAKANAACSAPSAEKGREVPVLFFSHLRKCVLVKGVRRDRARKGRHHGP